MNLEAIQKFLALNALLQVVYYVKGMTVPIQRIGRLHGYTEEVIVLTPHSSTSILNAYGSDIAGSKSLIDLPNVVEILILDDSEIGLKKILAENNTNI